MNLLNYQENISTILKNRKLKHNYKRLLNSDKKCLCNRVRYYKRFIHFKRIINVLKVFYFKLGEVKMNSISTVEKKNRVAEVS